MNMKMNILRVFSIKNILQPQSFSVLVKSGKGKKIFSIKVNAKADISLIINSESFRISTSYFNK